MRLKFLLATCAFASITFTSCEKDDPVTPSNPSNSGSGGTSSKKLKKIKKTEDGITTVYNLDYDAANRLISYKTNPDTAYVLFSYDANGNLTGIEEKEEGFKNVYTYQYQNNVPVTGLFKSYELVSGQPDELIEDDHLSYTVTNNKVSNIHLEMMQSGMETDLQLTYTGDNLTRVQSDGTFPYTADFSFGTHHSAFPKVTNYVLDQAGFSLQFASKNEMLSASFDFPGTSLDQTTTTQYTYDSDGYVLTSNDGSTQIVFEYQ